MNYEKLYKEALNKARKELQCCGDLDCDTARQIFRLFPELKESKDERISREITEFLVDFNNGEYERPNENTIDSWLSWLEKQCKKDGQVIFPTFTFEDILAVKCCMQAMSKSEELYKKLQSLYDRLHDTVRPKFNVGDWITNGDYTWKIVEVKSLDYILQSQDGNIVDDTISHVDGNFSSFTIKDAKDGDVLVFDDIIMIFKNIRNDWPDICTANTYILYCNGIAVNDWCDFGHNAQPATKEQRDLLFQKMKEVGYEWDAEKKQLKEIEQKPTECSLPYGKNETAKKLIALAECLEMDGDCLFNGLSGNDYGKFLRALAIELTQPKQEWSKEDKKMWAQVINEIEAIKSNSSTIFEKNIAQNKIDWLKSLKYRINGE